MHVCVRGVMDVVFSVCIVTHGAVGARVWEVWVFFFFVPVPVFLVDVVLSGDPVVAFFR